MSSPFMIYEKFKRGTSIVYRCVKTKGGTKVHHQIIEANDLVDTGPFFIIGTLKVTKMYFFCKVLYISHLRNIFNIFMFWKKNLYNNMM